MAFSAKFAVSHACEAMAGFRGWTINIREKETSIA
jgi:hypothetical protein